MIININDHEMNDADVSNAIIVIKHGVNWVWRSQMGEYWIFSPKGNQLSGICFSGLLRIHQDMLEWCTIRDNWTKVQLVAHSREPLSVTWTHSPIDMLLGTTEALTFFFSVNKIQWQLLVIQIFLCFSHFLTLDSLWVKVEEAVIIVQDWL